MPDLTDVIGAVLRDLARSRVASDLFSREISREYEGDEILSAFPVPRAEIKQASVGLKFVVNGVESKRLTREDVLPRRAEEHAATFVRRTGAELPGEAAEPDHERLLVELTEAVRDAFTAGLHDLGTAPEGRTEELAERLRVAAFRVLFQDPERRDALTAGRELAELRAAVGALATAQAEDYAAVTDAGLRAVAEEAGRVEVGVTLGELVEVPESVLSQIQVVTEIRNYTWVEAGDGDNTVHRLQPE